MLQVKDTAFVLIDVQGKLAEIVDHSEELLGNVEKLVQGVQALELPIIWNEQYPKGLGPTHPRLAGLLSPELEPISKRSFSCCGESAFVEAVEQLGRKHLLVAGIEAHICVYQTVADLLQRGYSVHVVVDGVSSRKAYNKELAIRRMETLGACLTSVEMCLFELLQEAKGDAFRTIQGIVK